MFLDEHRQRSSITSYQVSSVIQDSASALGIDLSHLNSHSLRAGGATHIFRAGFDHLTIQFHGRRTSNAYKFYTSLCKESVVAIASKIVSESTGDSTLGVWSCGHDGLGHRLSSLLDGGVRHGCMIKYTRVDPNSCGMSLFPSS